MNDRPDRLIFEYISGSHLYGTNIPTSDIDIKGVYFPSNPYELFEAKKLEQGDKEQNIKYFDLRKFLRLAVVSNPNILEALWVPADKKLFEHPVWKVIENRRAEFLSKKTVESHLGYAISQIKKAKGANKRVVNPQPKERPKKDDYCFIIPMRKYTAHIEDNNIAKQLVFNVAGNTFTIASAVPELLSSDKAFQDFIVRVTNTPSRPIPLKDLTIDLSKCHVARLEHVSNTFRLYYYGDEAKGVFRGNETLVTESIPLEDEYPRFIGLLIYNELSYERAVIEWEQYWEWVNNRNEERWIKQESGELDYDSKNMMHLFRMLFSVKHVLLNNILKVNVEGEEKDFLMKVRGGEFKYTELLERVTDLESEIREVEKKSTLPDEVDKNMVESVYSEMCSHYNSIESMR